MAELLDRRVYATTCLCLAVQRAARTLGRKYNEALAGAGLSNAQFAILMGLSGDRPLAVGELAAELDQDRTTLSAALKPLEKQGLVRLSPDPADGRARLVAMTDRGRYRLDEAIPRWQAAQAEVLRAARLEDAGALRAALAALG
jgi:DNA-binding MarR family transcriptional regulator